MSEEFKVSEKQISDAKNTFTTFDKKQDNTVQTKDLGKLFKALGLSVSDEKLKKWSDDMDVDARGILEWEQFSELFCRKLKEDIDERELREAFRVLDKNNKGVIDTDILRWILRSLGDDLEEEDIEAMIQDVDTDASGTVDYEEFKSLMISDDAC